MKRTAVITGATGQDSSYLAELLLEKDYHVIGLKRRSSVDTCERLAGVLNHPDFELIEGDITDSGAMHRLISTVKPREFYNLAAMSHVGTSFQVPASTFEIDAAAPLYQLEAIRLDSPQTRFYQASTSELFGDTEESPQSEHTSFRPNSLYAVAKLAAHHSVGLYRRAYGLHASAGILFNHESPRRGGNFVTRKITLHVAQLAATLAKDKLPLLQRGNLQARRDWGHARDCVRAMHLMLQQNQPDDYVIATGKTHSVEEFAREAFEVIGACWKDHVVSVSSEMRPADVHLLCGNASRARVLLEWQPTVSFKELVTEMVTHDCRALGIEIGALV